MADARPYELPQLHELGVLTDLIHRRHSERGPFEPEETLSERDLHAMLENARWAPTAHNMQNFEVVVVDDRHTLDAISRIETEVSEEFLRENYAQLSFSERELVERGTGLLATMFPPTWQAPGAGPSEEADVEHGFLEETMRSCPVVMVVVFDTTKRAPASQGDFLGIMSLGCVMENLWLTAESLGIGMQIMSVFSSPQVEDKLRTILSIPAHMKVAFACRLGYRAVEPGRYLRVRRPVEHFTHRNVYGAAPKEGGSVTVHETTVAAG